jgi:hypothetical protein
MSKLELNNITLFSLSSYKLEETQKAIDICLKKANFSKVIFLQNNPFGNDIIGYSKFMLEKLPNIINTDYVLVVQWDGFIINPDAWTNDFLNYDYIGAPWPQYNHICGNGGFSLRSKKFLDAQKSICHNINYKKFRGDDSFKNIPEDLILAHYFREKFEKVGCSFAPSELGYRFSIEVGDYDKNNLPFGFHGVYHPEFYE